MESTKKQPGLISDFFFARLQNTKSIHKNQLYFPVLAMYNWELKFSNSIYINIKEQEILKNKSLKRWTSAHCKL